MTSLVLAGVLTCTVLVISRTQAQNTGTPDNPPTLTLLDILKHSGVTRNTPYSNFNGTSKDIDKDQNGEISEKELEDVFMRYMDILFKIFDTNGDGLISQDEIRSPNIDLKDITKILDEAAKWAPVKQMIFQLDFNRDGFISEEDFNQGQSELRPDFNSGPYRRRRSQNLWPLYKESVLIADKNKDNKVSFEEQMNFMRSMLETIFNLLDQNDDGGISLDDITLNIGLAELTPFTMDIIDAWDDSGITEYNMTIFGKYFDIDLNDDGIVNLKDWYAFAATGYIRYDTMGFYNLAQLSRTLDKNQDGVIKLVEIQEFFTTFINIIDTDSDVFLTLEDGYNMLLKSGVPANQVEVLRNYIQVIINFLKSSFQTLADELLKEIDTNGDGSLGVEELYKLRPPCMFDGRSRIRTECKDFVDFKMPRFPTPPEELRRFRADPLAIIASILDDPHFYTHYDPGTFENIRKINSTVGQLHVMAAVIGVLGVLSLILLAAVIVLVIQRKGMAEIRVPTWLRLKSETPTEA
jgi:Ca2+-binding EF-hand superfamily protein